MKGSDASRRQRGGSEPPHMRGRSKLSFSKTSELVGDGAPTLRCRPIIHRLFSEALADRIDGLVGARSRNALFCARTPPFIGKPKRQLQLHDRMRFEV